MRTCLKVREREREREREGERDGYCVSERSRESGRGSFRGRSSPTRRRRYTFGQRQTTVTVSYFDLQDAGRIRDAASDAVYELRKRRKF